MRQLIWIVQIAVAGSFTGYFYGSLIWRAGGYHMPETSIGLAAGVFAFVVFLALKLYCMAWRQLESKGLLLKIYEHVLVPVVTLCIPAATIFRHVHLTSELLSDLSSKKYLGLLIAALIFADFTGFLRNVIKDYVFTNKQLAPASLYVRFPPQTRGDMWPMDALYNGLWIIIFALWL